MNVLPVAGPESTTLFTVTVEHSGRPPARRAGPVEITVPLNRLQGALRRLRLDGEILSVTPAARAWVTRQRRPSLFPSPSQLQVRLKKLRPWRS